jgi:hypothetical protein
MTDRSHCPTDAYGNPQQYFSPAAPPEHCAVHSVSEPSTLPLLLIAFVLWALVRKISANMNKTTRKP